MLNSAKQHKKQKDRAQETHMLEKVCLRTTDVVYVHAL